MLSKSITLSAPNTNSFSLALLTLVALISARFLLIISGDAPSFVKLSLIGSSSMLELRTSHSILFFSKISFLTLLLDANIILFFYFCRFHEF